MISVDKNIEVGRYTPFARRTKTGPPVNTKTSKYPGFIQK